MVRGTDATNRIAPAVPRPLLAVETARQERSYVVALKGDFDFAAAGLVDSELRAAERSGAPSIVLDMSRLEFIDCSGVRVVLRALARARRFKIELGIVPGPQPVQRVFDLTGTASQLPLVDAVS